MTETQSDPPLPLQAAGSGCSTRQVWSPHFDRSLVQISGVDANQISSADVMGDQLRTVPRDRARPTIGSLENSTVIVGAAEQTVAGGTLTAADASIGSGTDEAVAQWTVRYNHDGSNEVVYLTVDVLENGAAPVSFDAAPREISLYLDRSLTDLDDDGLPDSYERDSLLNPALVNVSNAGAGTLAWTADTEASALIRITPQLPATSSTGVLMVTLAPDLVVPTEGPALRAQVLLTDVGGAESDQKVVTVFVPEPATPLLRAAALVSLVAFRLLRRRRF